MSKSSLRRTAGARRPFVVLTFMLLATLALGIAGCAKSKTDSPSSNQGLSNVDPTASATTGGGNPSGATSTASPAKTSAKPSATRSNAPSGPHIDLFVVVGNPGCGSPGGPGVDPVSGSVKLSWKVSGGVTKVGLSIDDTATFQNTGHGSWQDYAAVDSATVPFVCDGAKGNKTHKYTLDTIDGGTHVSKTLTLTAFWEGAP
jgi:hypothetical protein